MLKILVSDSLPSVRSSDIFMLRNENFHFIFSKIWKYCWGGGEEKAQKVYLPPAWFELYLLVWLRKKKAYFNSSNSSDTLISLNLSSLLGLQISRMEKKFFFQSKIDFYYFIKRWCQYFCLQKVKFHFLLISVFY